jgi:hypothetical protein
VIGRIKYGYYIVYFGKLIRFIFIESLIFLFRRFLWASISFTYFFDLILVSLDLNCLVEIAPVGTFPLFLPLLCRY